MTLKLKLLATVCTAREGGELSWGLHAPGQIWRGGRCLPPASQSKFCRLQPSDSSARLVQGDTVG